MPKNMPKAGAAAAQMCPGFRPHPAISMYSLRAIKTLYAVRARIMERTETETDTKRLGKAMFRSTLLSPTQEAASQAKAWTFSLGLEWIGDREVKLAEIPEDVLSVNAVKDMVEELGQEGVLATNRVSITNVAQVDENTLSMTVNLLEPVDRNDIFHGPFFVV